MGDRYRVRWLLFALAALTPAWSQEVSVHLDPGSTEVNFTLGDVLHTVRGSFKLRQGDLWFDPSTGKAGGQLVVDAASGESGSHARDNRMSRNFLQTDRYPEIIFKPDRMEGKVNTPGDSQFRLHGLFTLHGATHELAMNVKSHVEADHVKANGDFDVAYQNWGIKNPSTLFLRVNDTVQIHIEAAGRLSAKR